MSCHCDYGHVAFYHKELRKARKQHVCDECSAIIQSGEQYEHVRGKYEGYVYSANTCSRCLELREWVKAHIPCFCWYHNNMIEDVQMAVEEYARETVGLGFGALRRIVKIRRHSKASRLAKKNGIHFRTDQPTTSKGEMQ